MKPTESYESTGEIRSLIDDLFPAKPWVYWLDLLISSAAGWGLFTLACLEPDWGWRKCLFLVGSAFSNFRALVFVHEIIHFKPGMLPGFRWVWNFLIGFPFLLPDYTYWTHYYHHRLASFSTPEDPEYLPLSGQSNGEIIVAFVIFLVLPPVLLLRYLLLGPLAWIVDGRFKEWVLGYMSTLKMNPLFQWKNISSEERRGILFMDLLCFVFWIGVLAAMGKWHRWDVLLNGYVVFYLIFAINHLRSFARHRYVNVKGNSVSYEAQLLDSLTISGFSPMASLFMPIGLRWHSIHHMFPTLPYHAMPAAHKRLAAKLPKDHLYFKTLVPDFITAVGNIFRKTYKV
jgi:fatty acid desaturase